MSRIRSRSRASVGGTAEAFNEPSGMTTFTHADGSSLDFGTGWTASAKWSGDTNYNEVVVDATNPTGSGFAIEKRWKVGDDTDNANGLTTRDHWPFACDVLYIRLRVKWSANWDTDPDYGGMKFFYYGLEGHEATAPTEFWTSNNSAGTPPWKIHFASNIDGDTPVEDTTAASVLSLDTWHTLEYLHTAQSARDAADGTLKLWVDGVLVLDLTGKNWQTASADLTSTLFDGMQFFMIRGSSGSTFDTDDSLRIGELKISGKIAGPVASVTLSGGDIDLNDEGSPVTRTASALNAAGHAMRGQSFSAVSSNEAVATVSVDDDDVTVTPVAEGSCTITVASAGIDSSPIDVTVGPAAAPAFVSDDFNGEADGTLLTDHVGATGATWTANAAQPGTFKLSAAGRCRPNNANVAVAYASGVPATADYDVEATLVIEGNTGQCQIAVGGRYSTVADSGYMLMAEPWGGQGWVLYKVTAGTAVSIGSEGKVSATFSVNDTYTMKLEMRGDQIKGYVNGVQVLSATDSTYAAKGKVAVVGYNGDGSTAVWTLTDLSATDA